ncbi:MAG: hypothetical protein ACPGUV_08420, partial [Polyangiales bacterium]
AEFPPFFLKQAGDRSNLAVTRLQAVQSYALLTNKDEAKALETFIAAEPDSIDGGYRKQFSEHKPLIAVAKRCDAKVPCWIGKLKDSKAEVVSKAAHMLARYASGNAKAIQALVPVLGHPHIEARVAAASAIDRIAPQGSKEAVEKIDALRDKERGRSIWKKFASEALSVQARLRARGAAR